MFSRVVLLILCATAANSSDNIFRCNDKLHCFEHQIIKFFDETVNILNKEIVLKKVNNSDKTMKTTEGVLERYIRFLNGHELKVHLHPSHGNSENEARTRKLKKFILPLLVLLKLKAVIVIPLILTAVAFTAFNGLGVSLMALIIATAIGLENLLEGHHSTKLTYEFVPQVASPYWRRAGIETLPIGYHTIP